MATQADKPAPLSFPEGPRERLQHYRLDRFVNKLPTMPPIRSNVHFDPSHAECKAFYVQVPVQSLADAKLWMGFPNDHIDHTRYWQHLRTVAVPPAGKRRGGELLSEVPPQTIANAEHNLLFGFVDEMLLANPFWQAVSSRMLERLKQIAILVASDLIVNDGQSVTISNTPTAFFHRVTVYGSGSIIHLDDCKMIADTIEHLPAPAGGSSIGAHINP